MYFKIGTIKPDLDFSWILFKNPATTFTREIKQGTVTARFLDGEGQIFEGWFANDPGAFVRAMKDANFAHYVHFQLAGVCPANLTAFEDCFRSAISGKVSGELDEARTFAPKELEAVIGPYPRVDEDFFVEVWAAFGITAEAVDDGTDAAKMWRFTGTMSVTEFLQKIYLLSYYFTERQRLHSIQSSVIEKFARRCAAWFAQCDDNRIKGKILKRLCKFNQELMKTFRVTYDALQSSADDANGDDAPPKGELEDILDKKNPTLHETRHRIIIEETSTYLSDRENDDEVIVLDWGMGDAKLTKKLANKLPKGSRLRGIDANEKRISRAKRRARGDFRVQNLLFPNEQYRPTVLINCEVIEHLRRQDRFRALMLMRDFYQPELLILTTPNFEHNINWDGLIDEEGGIRYRHGDHKIEYTRPQFEEEIVSYLERDYDIEWRDVINLDDYEIRTDENKDDPDVKTLRAFNQPSFIIVCRRKTGVRRPSNNSPFARNYHTVSLPVSGTEVYGKELERGFADRGLIANGHNITYLGPTVPPVDFHPDYPNDLEHPMTALRYYYERGVKEVFIEKKHMGSRATVLVFRTKQIAELFGFDTEVVVTSRKGFPFFRESDQDDFYALIHAEIAPKLERDNDDFVMLDCEMMPWRYKAPRLIENDFQAPGEAAMLFRRYTGVPGEDRAQRFNEVLSWFTEDGEVHCKMFQLLAKGRAKTRDGKLSRMEDAVLGSTLHRTDMYDYLTTLTGDFFQFDRGIKLDLNRFFNAGAALDLSPTGELSVIAAPTNPDKIWLERYWRHVTEDERCEGVVVKPAQFFTQLPSGYYVQPMIKVRGMPYLHLIYGIDITDPEYFKNLTRRRIKAKRILAITQHELGDMMLRAFIHTNTYLRQRVIAAFYGNEHLKFHDLDKTL